MKKNIKKSLVAMLAAALSIACIAGCGKKNNETENTQGETTTATEGTETDNEAGIETETSEQTPLDLANWDGTRMNVTDLELAKYVEVGDYKSIEVNLVDQYFVSDDDLDYILKQQIGTTAPTVAEENCITDRAVENGDVISLDFEGKKDGVAFDGGTAQGYTLWIGSHSFIDGFEDGLVGVMPGETVDLDLTFPENYGNADLAGQAVVFTCTVNYIIPEEAIVDAFNATTGSEPVVGYDGIKGFWKEYYDAQIKQQYDADLENAIVQELVGIATYKDEFPDNLVYSYQQDASDLLDQYAQVYGTDADTLAAQLLGISKEQFIYQNSYEQLKIDVVLATIAEKEGFVLDEEALKARLNEFITTAGYDPESEEVKELNPEDYRITFLTEDVMNYLRENVKVNLN